MAILLEKDTSFHPGELSIHTLLRVPSCENPTIPYFPSSTASFFSTCQLLILGTLDSEGRPWTSIITGINSSNGRGFMRGLNNQYLAVNGNAPVGDPVLENFQGKGEWMVSGLGADLTTRRRVKVFGRVQEGMARVNKAEGGVQIVWCIEQSLGNCPKYITTRHLSLHSPPPVPTPLTFTSSTLPSKALSLIQNSDIFFLSTRNGATDMDTNHRGGAPGFVRITSSSSFSSTILLWPEYSGNRLYQTLGNLAVTPKAGLTFPDFRTGDVLYLTGEARILSGDEAEAVFPRVKLAVQLTVLEGRFLENALSIREASDSTLGFSPYNPPVRFLSTEQKTTLFLSQNKGMVAKLIRVKNVTPTISRFTFSLPEFEALNWKAGQYIALSFEKELGLGYKHMDDSDPTSLNDDYIRTFTVSSSPVNFSSEKERTFDITVRKTGVVTSFLFRSNPSHDIEVAMKGFGGEFLVGPDTDGEVRFVAGGVGITPLLAVLPEVNVGKIRLWWSVRCEDMGLVKEVLKEWPGLREGVKVFVTGGGERYTLEGVKLDWRRIVKKDLDLEGVRGEKWWVCAGRGLRSVAVGWLREEGRDVSTEMFEF